MRRAASMLVGATVLVAAGQASAFVRTTTDALAAVRWPRACVIITAHIANPPPNLTPELAVSAARAAAAVWSRDAVACPDGKGTGFELQIATVEDSDAPAAHDKTNNLVFRRAAWEYDPSALAITTVFANQNTGTILDADVELNAVNEGRFKWGDLVAGIGVGAKVEDLQNTLTHEFGHLLGLDHNCFLQGSMSRRGIDHQGLQVPECDRSSAEVQDATMFAAVTPGDILRRTLAPDDIAGVCAVYPASAATMCIAHSGPDGEVNGRGCSAGGGGAAGGLGLLAALGLLSALRRRARRPAC